MFSDSTGKSKSPAIDLETTQPKEYYVAVNDSLRHFNNSSDSEQPKDQLQIKLSFKDPVEIERLETDDLDTPIRVPDDPYKEFKSSPQIHEDVQSVLEYVYYQNGMTIISEEASRQMTEMTHGGTRFSEKQSSKPNVLFNLQSPPEEGKESNAASTSKMGNSIEPWQFSDQPGTPGEQKERRLTKSTQPVEARREHWEIEPIFLEKYSITDMKNKAGNKSSGGRPGVDKQPGMTTTNIFLKKKKKQSYKSRFKFKPVTKPHLASLEQKTFSMSSLGNNSDIKLAKQMSLKHRKSDLPKFPKKPKFEIKALEQICAESQVHKKLALVLGIEILLENGIIFQGSLAFGKLSGVGCLLKEKKGVTGPGEKKFLLFEGEFKDNQIQGKGVLYFRDGGTFEGGFKEGKAHGYGKLVKNDGTPLVEGVWIDGVFYN